FAGSGENIVMRVIADRLNRVAEFLSLMSIIDDQSGAPACPNGFADLFGNRRRRRTDFANGTAACDAALVPERQRNRLRRQRKSEAILPRYNQALAPTTLGHHELANRQSVKKLVRDDEHRPFTRDLAPLANPIDR